MRAPWVGAGAQWPPYGLKRVGDGRAVPRSSRNVLEAFDMKEHTQQAYMWIEDQSRIKDDFWNLKLIPIQFCQPTGS